MEAKRFKPNELLSASNKVVSFKEELAIDAKPRTAATSQVKVDNLLGRELTSAQKSHRKSNLTII